MLDFGKHKGRWKWFPMSENPFTKVTILSSGNEKQSFLMGEKTFPHLKIHSHVWQFFPTGKNLVTCDYPLLQVIISSHRRSFVKWKKKMLFPRIFTLHIQRSGWGDTCSLFSVQVGCKEANLWAILLPNPLPQIDTESTLTSAPIGSTQPQVYL